MEMEWKKCKKGRVLLASDVMGGKFPTPYTNESQAALQSGSSVTLQNDSASTQCEIQGSIKGARRGPLTATVSANTTFSDDQTNTAQDYWGLVHGAQFTTLDESLTGAGVHLVRDSQDAYTVDSGGGFYQSGPNFFLPANVTQSLNQEHQLRGLGSPYSSSLYENGEGYGTLQSAQKNISQGATTGVAMYHDSSGYQYHAFVMARGEVM